MSKKAAAKRKQTVIAVASPSFECRWMRPWGQFRNPKDDSID